MSGAAYKYKLDILKMYRAAAEKKLEEALGRIRELEKEIEQMKKKLRELE